MSLKNTAIARQSFAATDSAAAPRRAEVARAQRICRRLEAAGVEPLLLLKGDHPRTNTALLEVHAENAFGSGVAVAQFRDQAFALLARGLRVSVAITGLGSEMQAPALFRRVCEALALAASDACVCASGVEIAVAADALAPRLIWLIRREILREGAVYLIADGERMSPTDVRAAIPHCEQFWLQLWHLRDVSLLRAACGSMVSSRCPLLSAETATNILPSVGVQVPAGTAWVPIKLNLARFTDARGAVCEPALEAALHRCVDMGDLLHDLLRWPTAMMRHDAWLNRRLAVIVTGIGDVAKRRRLDPQHFNCRQSLDELLLWMRQTLQTRSRLAARRTNVLPALELTDPSRSLSEGSARDDWRIRWRRAVDQEAVRNRNLMVLSPWSVFPQNQPADMRYADLLPVVAYGDACAFSRSATLAHWNFNEFKNFHQRAWAALQQRDAATLIAEQV